MQARKVASLCAIAAFIFAATAVVVVQQRSANVEITGHIVKPESIASAGSAPQLKVPTGFVVETIAEKLPAPSRT